MGWRIRVVHSTGYRYDDPGAPVVQRGPAHPAQRLPAERHRQPGGDHARDHAALPLHRLLGHRGHRVRPARPAHRAGGRRDVGGRDRRRRSRRSASATWAGPARPTRSATGTPRSWSSPATSAATRSWRRSRGCCARSRRPSRRCTRRARWVHDHLTYQPGSTGVHTSALEAWEAGKGVCQDYVHLTLLLLREVGIPARYVSGYLLPKTDAEVRQTVTGESHAWVEAWTGRLVGLRPHERHRDRPAARVGGERPRLRRRPAAQGRLLGRHRLGPRRHGGHDPPGLSPARCFRIFITPAHSPCHDPAADRGVATSQSLRTARRRRGPSGTA